MAASATVRDLRNHFPKVKKLVEEEGEVIVTDQGTPRYRLTRYMREDATKRQLARAAGLNLLTPRR